MNKAPPETGEFLSTVLKKISYVELIDMIDLLCDVSGGEERFVELYSLLDERGKSTIARLGDLLGEHHRSTRRLTDAVSAYQAVPSKGGNGRSKKFAVAKAAVNELVEKWKRGDLPRIRYAYQLAAMACEDPRINVAQRTVENWISVLTKNRSRALNT